MLTILRKQKITPKKYEVGDQIHLTINNYKYTATAIKRETNGMLFWLDSCLNDKKRYLKRHGRNFDGNWEDTDLRKFLQKLVNHVPVKLKNEMIPFENGDYFRLLTREEIMKNHRANKNTDRWIPFLDDRSMRMKSWNGNSSYYWLQTKSTEDNMFDIMDGWGTIYCGGDYPDAENGVVPAFLLKD